MMIILFGLNLVLLTSITSFEFLLMIRGTAADGINGRVDIENAVLILAM